MTENAHRDGYEGRRGPVLDSDVCEPENWTNEPENGPETLWEFLMRTKKLIDIANRELRNRNRALEAQVDGLKAKLEPPMGKDGEPIAAGQLVWGEDGKEWHVFGIVPGHTYCVIGQAKEGAKTIMKPLKPKWLTHERPDTMEQAVGGLFELAENLLVFGGTHTADVGGELDAIVKRIVRLSGGAK